MIELVSNMHCELVVGALPMKCFDLHLDFAADLLPLKHQFYHGITYLDEPHAPFVLHLDDLLPLRQ